MADREDQYNSHPVWGHLDRIDARLEETEARLGDAGADAVSAHARVRSVARYVRSLLDRSDPNLVVLSRLSNLQNQLQSVASELDAFQSNGQVQHLVNGSNNCDNVLAQVDGLPAVASPEDVGGIRKDVASFRKSAAAYLRGVESEAQSLRDALQQSRQRADELANELQEQKGRLDQAIAQFQQLSQDAISKQQTQANEALGQWQSQFSEAQERRANEFRVEPDMADSVHQLKVTLRGVKPPVWRRIVVRSDLSLGELAPLLEGAMGWLGGHLHAFDVDGTSYGSPDPDWPSDDLDESEFRLGQVLPSVGDKMRWDYDFGDGWEHNVVVEKILEAEPGVEYPICLAGKRACPPEDCGGPHGYAQLLEVLADPSHPEHEELKEWASIDFDPDYFDVEEASLEMRSPRPLEGW